MHAQTAKIEGGAVYLPGQAPWLEAETVRLHGYREFPSPPRPDRVWKAAPRDGVWATPPFMHNGSVPNLYEMLIPAAERTTKFYRGHEFDPVKVGLDTTASSGTFLMDTTLLGNSNKGHSFQNGPRGNGIIGPLLKDDERWAIVEYLKSIPEEQRRDEGDGSDWIGLRHCDPRCGRDRGSARCQMQKLPARKI
jgi:hypothetical protein